MRNLGITFLTMIALFMGGCSLLFLLSTGECFFTDHGSECGIAGLILIVAVPILAFAVLLGLLTWLYYRMFIKRVDNRKNRKMPQTTTPVVGKVGFSYRGHRVVVNNDFYFFDGQNFQSVEAVKAHIDSYLTDP